MSFAWTPERDAELRRLRAEGMRIPDIAEELGTTTARVFQRRRDLGLPEAPRGGNPKTFFNAARDETLRKLWAMTPELSLREIRRAFGNGVSESAISQRAVHTLKLPMRQARRDPAPRLPVARAETPPPPPPPRIDATPCPYIDPRASRDPVTGKVAFCGVMVDRRPRRDGSRPSQYCKDHAPRVTPIAAGMSIGAGSRAGSRLLNAGAKVGGVLG